MDISNFLKEIDSEFYAGVPDSQLKSLCNCLIDNFGISTHHIIAANEGNCVALAAGYYLATGKIPVVYMQNSGIGNIVNPVVSLLNEKVYRIPCVFIVGWRGEPGIHDEPQHIFQGEISKKLLNDIGIYTIILEKNSPIDILKKELQNMRDILQQGKSVAFLVRKDALLYDRKVEYKNSYKLIRESVMEHILEVAKKDIVVSTTGKTSRELFEIRKRRGEGHQSDFLTVGSMGHSSSIALGIALNQPNRKVWCIDGDGSALMHMGSMAVIGSCCPTNFVHILINNEAHETVGGMPTVSKSINWGKIAEGCGYPVFFNIDTYEQLDEQLRMIKETDKLSLVEIKCAIGSRKDLGRPTITGKENKEAFMKYLKES